MCTTLIISYIIHVCMCACTHTTNTHAQCTHPTMHTHNAHAHTLKQSVLSMFERICGTVYKIAMFLTSFSVGCLVPSLCFLIPFFFFILFFFIVHRVSGWKVESEAADPCPDCLPSVTQKLFTHVESQMRTQ